jgi:rhodanese-related sulfurtransferase
MKLIPSLIAATLLIPTVHAEQKLLVNITSELPQFEAKINGKDVLIKRNQNQANTVNPIYAKTSRVCPPFCIQPIKLAEGVETIAELEIIGYLDKIAKGDSSVMVIDSRTPSWVAKGTIPGSVNLPWTRISPKEGATTQDIIRRMQENFGVKLAKDKDSFDVDEAIISGIVKEVFNFSNAKTLVMFCNGMWCGQSPANIKTLLKYGYPPEKIKWYRGGMQDWEILGLSTVKP